MSVKQKNICYIYKNDLKFNDDLNLQDSEFESDAVRSLYNNYKSKPKIELRIEDSRMENYEYLDLSKLEIDDEHFTKLLELNKIKKIMQKIVYLDLSNNNLKYFPDLSKYPNIKYLSISHNEIEQDINDDNLIELTCQYNKIKSIKSNKLTHLNASNNQITVLNIPNVVVLIISQNKLNWIQSYVKLVYLECIDNQLQKIDNMINLEELYVGKNNISKISNMPKLKVLNCVSNPIDKIKFFPNLKTLMSSTANVSAQYIVTNISKAKSDFVINFNV
jgi:hypothetical protein